MCSLLVWFLLDAATVKIIVVGNGGVGKTSLIRKYCKGQFTDEYKKTYPP